MSNLSNNSDNSHEFTQYEQDGLELLINESTGEVRMSQRAIQRLTGAALGSLNKFLNPSKSKTQSQQGLKGVHDSGTLSPETQSQQGLKGVHSTFDFLEIEIVTKGGVQLVKTYDEKCFIACVKKFNIDMIDAIIEAGTRLYLYGVAGYKVKVEKPNTPAPKPTQPALNPVEALIAKYPQLPPNGGVAAMARLYGGLDSVPNIFVPNGVEHGTAGLLNGGHCEWLAYWGNQDAETAQKAAIAFKRMANHTCADFDKPSYERMSHKNVNAYNAFDSLLYKVTQSRANFNTLTPDRLMHYLTKCDEIVKNPDVWKDGKTKKFIAREYLDLP